MKKNALALLIMVHCLWASTALAASVVTVHTAANNPPLTIDNAAKLTDVVTRPEFQNTWWPGAVISWQGATVKAGQEQQQLLATLAALADDEGGDAGAAIKGVRQQLSQIQVTGRSLVNLDPDWLRLHPRSDVPLSGPYQLWLPAQPESIRIFGLVDNPGKKTFTPGMSVAEYIEDETRLSGAERSYVWVISPEGTTLKAPVAYWNKRHIEPSPGSTIFVGFSSHPFSSSWDGLNERIINALIHRIPD